jgi:HK97 family phage major capsid protein
MSQNRLREIRERLGQINEQVQEYRRKIADRATSQADRAAAQTSFNVAMEEVDTLTQERDETIRNNEREARAERLSQELGNTARPPQERDLDGVSNHVQLYDRALRRHGVMVVEKRGKLTYRNLALESLAPEVRTVIDGLSSRYWESLRRYLMAYSLGDTNRASADDRSIVFGTHPEFRGFLSAPKLNESEQRDMGIGTLTLGGYFVPRGFVYEIEEALKYYGPMLEIAELMDTATGQPLPYPTDNDTTIMGEIVGENDQVSEKDVTIGQVLFGAFKFSSKMVKLSIELMQDSAFDMEGYIKKKLAIRLGRIYNNKFTVGSGVGEPTGIVTAVVAACGAPSANPGQAYGIPLIASGSSSNTGGAETGGTSIGSKDIDNLEHTVDPSYRRGASYMFHDQTLRVVKVLLDKYGRPLWKPGVASGDPDTINGYPYHVNNDMTQTPAVAGAGNNTVLFGQLDKYVIRRVLELGIVTLRERFADYGQLALIGFSRADGQLLDAGTHPVCYLQQAAV